MKHVHRFTEVIEREGDGYVSLCPELDLASQGETIEEARQNLVEALELFFETADPSEIQQRMRTEVSVTPPGLFRWGAVITRELMRTPCMMNSEEV